MFPRLQQAWKENKWAVVLHVGYCIATLFIVYWMFIPAIESQDRGKMFLAFLVQLAISIFMELVFKIAPKTWMMGLAFMLSGFLLIAFAFGSIIQTLIATAGGILFFTGIKLCRLESFFPFSLFVKAREAWVEWTTRPHTQKIPDGTGENGTDKHEEKRPDKI